VERLVRGLEHLFAKKDEVKEGVQKAAALTGDDPEMALVRSRKLLESAVRDVYQRRLKEPPGNRSLEKLAERLDQNGYFPDDLDVVGVVQKLSGSQKMSGPELTQLFAQVMEILKWYMEVEQPDAVGELTGQPRQQSIKG